MLHSPWCWFDCMSSMPVLDFIWIILPSKHRKTFITNYLLSQRNLREHLARLTLSFSLQLRYLRQRQRTCFSQLKSITILSQNPNPNSRSHSWMNVLGYFCLHVSLPYSVKNPVQSKHFIIFHLYRSAGCQVYSTNLVCYRRQNDRLFQTTTSYKLKCDNTNMNRSIFK